MMDISFMPHLNFVILQGNIYNIKYWQDLHLIKFDLWQMKYGKGKRTTPLRLSCEVWHQDKILDKLNEGGYYCIVGELREYVFEKENGKKHKYALNVRHIREMKKTTKEEKEENNV